jgi:hypothetical protein
MNIIVPMLISSMNNGGYVNVNINDTLNEYADYDTTLTDNETVYAGVNTENPVQETRLGSIKQQEMVWKSASGFKRWAITPDLFTNPLEQQIALIFLLIRVLMVIILGLEVFFIFYSKKTS